MTTTSETPRIDVPVAHLRNVVSGIKNDALPIDLACVTLWQSWTYEAFKCLYCDSRVDQAYEVTFQWGDTNRYTYLSEMCAGCLSVVCKKSRNATESKYAKIF